MAWIAFSLSQAIEKRQYKSVEKEWERKRNIPREKRPGLTHCERALFLSSLWSNVLITDLINMRNYEGYTMLTQCPGAITCNVLHENIYMRRGVLI
ncbi:hypothetical protein EVAR_34266_1 [Eumeta japonica]|uniref:Uncharacterized protein n=1 Tax=Eumeta variegata TaxID=151549 RepID=A0A4C1VXL2_EUMVA|nr:hypothetical protein EVAR_34266_1 [Eumeta japonica]